ncbi:Resolvase/invertase-type recombinase catalytic domain-containing protein [Frankia sp. AiPs1]|uniref:hypothetical protein n=1 Tax=Frankia sp. AiPa1 TaxID=573492 RepID=UPI00202B0375|nr:hypothetical protein [Frankia sp. AiPa1]MCL9758668.1 hypothetical protein [Frankia sp. AiPa1]
MPCPFSTRRTATQTATITEPADPPVVFYARITTNGHQQSLDDQHAQTLAYLTAHCPALLHGDRSEPARTLFPLAPKFRRVLPYHRRRA